MSRDTRMRPIARTEDDLLRLVTEHDGTVTGVVTPEVAGWLLRLNTGNRPLFKADVRRFEEILARGEWVNTGEPVIVSREGVLNDGQHRLEAIFRSCRSAPLDVRFGIPRAAFAATGDNRPRRASDVLALAGEINTRMLASIARVVDAYHRGAHTQPAAMVLPNARFLAVLEEHPEIRAASHAIACMPTPLRTAAVGAVLTLGAEATDAGTAMRFARALGQGDTPRGCGARELRERLMGAPRNRSRMAQIDRLVVCARGWNAWIEGRAVRTLPVQAADRTAAGFPRVLGAPRPRFRVAAA